MTAVSVSPNPLRSGCLGLVCILLLNCNFDAFVFDVQSDAGVAIHVNVSHPNQGKGANQVSSPVVIEQFEAGDEKEKERDVVAEAVFTGEQIEELSLQHFVAGFTFVLAPVTRFAKHFFVCNRPGYARNRNCQDEEERELLPEAHKLGLDQERQDNKRMPHDLASGAKPAGPCCLVVFGAAGDLTKRLVVPALYNLACAKLLPAEFAIVGFDRAELNDDSWRDELFQMLQQFVKGPEGKGKLNEEVWKWLTERMSYLRGDLTQPESYQALKSRIEERDKQAGTCANYLFYLAIADRFFATVIEHLGQSGLAKEEERDWRRVVVEKPFGHDLASAKQLNQQILRVLDESQVYRIDHFLGKETVQNIMLFRFANGIFEPLWNRDRIDHVQITVAETVGVEKRGAFYEKTGALRDMVPNHVFQLVAMTAMEPPNSFSADSIRSEKAKVIEAVKICSSQEAPCHAVRGQYGEGEIDGQKVVAYRSEPDVAPDSNVETYAAMRLSIDNRRWSGVPIYIRTGKRLARRKSQIAVKFKEVPVALLRDTGVKESIPNWLLLRIQPDEGIAFEFGAKIPGPSMNVGDVRMDFKYQDYFGTAPATGYETLIYDVMIGDATLFQRADNIEAGWQVVQPILDFWGSEPPKSFPNYATGSQGPAAADELLKKDGRSWRPIN